MVAQADRARKEEMRFALAEMLGFDTKQLKAATPSGTPTNIYAHGPGGLFSLPGVDPMVFNATIGVRSVMSQLPVRSSVDTNPLYTTVTGVTGETGAEKDGVCDDPPVAGLTKACTLTAVFGRYEGMTRELELNRLGQYVNRGDPRDLRMMNTPNNVGLGLFDAPFGRDFRSVVNQEVSKVFFELNTAMVRKLSRQSWIGNPTNNSANGGYKEFPGFDILIGTGKKDAETGVACPAMDSDVKNFNYKNVNGNDGGDIVQAMTYLFRYLRFNATHMGLDPATWIIAMRETAFYEVTAIWPCSYLTYMCNFNGREDQARLNVSADAQIAMRDDMRNNQYLLMDGIKVPVVFDDGIAEESNTNNANVASGSFASDIYFIPMTVLGGVPVTYVEHFDFRNSQMSEALVEGMYNYSYRVYGDGTWIVHAKPPNNWCLQWITKIEPRIIMRTPYLAGRLNNIEYSPLQHTRDAYPGDPYFVNGGGTSRNGFGPSYYNEWND